MGASGRTTIGLFLNTFYGEYVVRVWTGAAKAAAELGIALVSYADDSVDHPDPAVRGRKGLFSFAEPRSLDGIIVLSPSIADRSSKERLANFLDAFSSLPIVHVGVEDVSLTRVVAESYLGMRKLVDHLIELHGRTRIAFVRGPAGVSDAEERYAAYLASLEAHGIPFRASLVRPGDFRRDSGSAAASVLMDAGESFDALVGANDYMALYAMKELQRRGVRVPDDVAVAGFDDFLAARSSVPALCTVRQPTEELGSEAVRLVTAAIRGEAAPAERRSFPTQLTPRRSCGCISFGASEMGTTPSRELLIDAKGYEALAAALGANSEGKFRILLEDAVVAAYDRGTPVSAWQGLVPDLTCRLPSGARWEAERSIIRFLSALQEEIASRALLARIEEETVFDQVSGRLLGNFDAQAVREFLEGELSERDAFFCLSLYTGEQSAEVLFCTDKSLEGAALSPTQLVPGGLSSLPLRSDFLVLSLADREEAIGFFICATQRRQLSFFEVLREHLKGALLGARLVARIRDQNATLERKVEERTSDLAHALDDLRSSNEKLERLSSVDEMTGLYNRRGFFELAGRQFDLAKRRGSDLLLLFADLDSLKQINDTHGHAEGDAAIQTMGDILSRSFRQTDVVARLGGDEFIAMAIDCTMKECGIILDRAHALLDEHNASSGKPYKLSFSVGAAPSTGRLNEGLDGLMAEADSRLYEAKREAKETAQRAGRPAAEGSVSKEAARGRKGQ